MKPLYKEQSSGGSYGHFTLDIQTDCNLSQEQLRDSEAIRDAVYNAAQTIRAAILGEVIKNDPKAQERAVAERKAILDLFPSQIFVEEIPNGYCSDYCCRHLPWFIVTTNIGKIKIGWRKRVLEIDWSGTVNKRTAEQLFPAEDVTKSGCSIHAWGYDAAALYLQKILSNKD